jgi:glycosyltransferase involved in cell wall biosynthesis
MKIWLNAEATASWLGGRYYLENLTQALARLDPAERPELMDSTDGADAIFPNWGLRRTPGIAQLHWIPDLQHRALPQNFGRRDRLRRDLGYRRLTRQAQLVVVSSEAVLRDAAAAYRAARPKLRVLHFTTVISSLEDDDVASRYEIPRDYILLANQFWAHKNHATALAALERLSLPVVCTGEAVDHRRPGYAEALVETAQREHVDRLRVLGVVPRDDYLRLVRGARLVLQPSLYEGWSSIVEDARAFGRPIALSDIPVHREQHPDHGHYFAPQDPASLAEAVERAAADGGTEPEAALDAHEHRVVAYARRFLELVREARTAL